MYQGSKVSTGFKGAIGAFDGLVKAIKALDDELPLAVLNISPTTEHLRYTNVFTPVPLPATLASSMPENGRYLSPMEIILEFEKSSWWPDDLHAIQKIKLAFFERVATVLMTSIQGLKATVIIGDGVSSSEIRDNVRLELVTPEGWAFSARIWHSREVTLLDCIIDNKSRVLPHVTRKPAETQNGKVYQEALEAKEVYTRRFIHAPRHHRAVASLCHHFIAYAGTVRLVKRWLGSHWLLHSHIHEEVVEIICASFFVGDGQNIGGPEKGDQHAYVPGSKERGFANVVEFFKDWKWEDGLFVPLYGGADSSPGTQTFVATAGCKSGVWNVSMEADKEGCVWTSSGPDVILAHRVRSLAKATWDYLQGMEQGNLNVQVREMNACPALYAQCCRSRCLSTRPKTMTLSSN
jgi:U3 small nucleolar RNA-associated protein 22